MGKIIRDERYTNTVWCLCNNFEEYQQFAKDLWLYTDIERSNFYNVYLNGERIKNEERWFDNEYVWRQVFDVDPITAIEVDEDGHEWEIETPIDPINDSYEIKEKPKDEEYPVIVQYSLKDALFWISINKLK